MKKITVSAPGKLMLLGEHAVVYNRPCIVTAVDQRMQATIELLDEPVFVLEAPDVKITGYKKPMSEIGNGDIPKGAKFVEIAVKSFWGAVRLQNLDSGQKARMTGMRVTTKSEFSSQFGFGSSSASTVCIIKGLSKIFGLKLTNKQIFDIAFKTVLDVQGKGSGFDVAAAMYGGTLYFVTGGKVIKPLAIKTLPLVVGYSGVKADTVTLINQVSVLAKKYPRVIENIYDQIENLVELAKKAMLKNDWQTVGELFNINQGLLSSLGVSGQKLEDMIYTARNAGAYGAKLSGAGGGDCMIALSSKENKKVVSESITKAGGHVLDVLVNAPGVRVEK